MKYKTMNKEVRVYKNLPKGWKVTQGTLTQPAGTVWINNGKSLFPKNGKPSGRKNALLVTDEQLMTSRIAEKRRLHQEDDFITDKTAEAKIRAEIRRQNRENRKANTQKKPMVRKASAATVAKKCPAKAAAKKPMRTVRKPMTAKKASTPIKKK